MLRLKSIIALPLLLLLHASSQAQTLQPFDAQYAFYRGGNHVADASFSLAQQNTLWLWTLKTRPIGFYRLLTRKRPYAETLMQQTDDGPRLLLEQSGDYEDKPAKQGSYFDVDQGKLYYSQGDKATRMTLPDNLYNYHSIHLLYAQMRDQQLEQIEVNFYDKGELARATLTLERNVEVSLGDDSRTADRVTQRNQGSKKYMVYYYDQKSPAPLVIERIRPGKDSSMMWRVDSSS